MKSSAAHRCPLPPITGAGQVATCPTVGCNLVWLVKERQKANPAGSRLGWRRTGRGRKA